jgi:hypothetical protein
MTGGEQRLDTTRRLSTLIRDLSIVENMARES